MKNYLILAFVFFTTIINLNAQNLKEDCSFLKTTTLSFAVINSFKQIERTDLNKDELAHQITLIENNIKEIEMLSNKLFLDYKGDEDIEEFKSWVLSLKKSLEFLKNDKSEWNLLYNLLEMNMMEFVNSKY